MKLISGGDARGKVVKSAAAVISGTFTITLATYAVLMFSGGFDHLLITGTSTLATVLIGAGVKPSLLGDSYLHRDWPNPFLIGAGGIALALEAMMIITTFPNAIPVIYALSIFAGSYSTLWGNYIFSSLRIQVPVGHKGITENLLTP